MRRGAFTLVEVIVVVALITSIAAIVLPSLASRIVSGRAGHAVRAIESAVVLASAQAMRRGEIVELVAERDRDEWVLYAQEPALGGMEEDDPTVDGATGLPRTLTTAGWRVELVSFSGVELSAVLPESGEERLDGATEDLGLASDPLGLPVGREAPPLWLSLGFFFPDGVCRAKSPLYVVSSDGLRRAIHLRPLTSRVDVRVLPTAEEEARQAASADEAEALVPVVRKEDER